jgi:hypothetical protein
MKNHPVQKAVLEATAKLQAENRTIDVRNITRLVFPDAHDETWRLADRRVRSAIQELKRRNSWRFELQTRKPYAIVYNAELNEWLPKNDPRSQKTMIRNKLK